MVSAIELQKIFNIIIISLDFYNIKFYSNCIAKGLWGGGVLGPFKPEAPPPHNPKPFCNSILDWLEPIPEDRERSQDIKGQPYEQIATDSPEETRIVPFKARNADREVTCLKAKKNIGNSRWPHQKRRNFAKIRGLSLYW
jgi:hypothetical protein